MRETIAFRLYFGMGGQPLRPLICRSRPVGGVRVGCDMTSFIDIDMLRHGPPMADRRHHSDIAEPRRTLEIAALLAVLAARRSNTPELENSCVRSRPPVDMSFCLMWPRIAIAPRGRAIGS